MTITILSDQGTVAVPTARVEGDAIWLELDGLAAATGWSLKPEGLCRGEVCIPLRAEARAEHVRDGEADVLGLWRRLGRPAVASEAGDVLVLGQASDERAAALHGLEAPDFALPDIHGDMDRLSDHRGEKVFLTTWASW